MPQKINILVIEPYRFLPPVNGGNKAIEQLYSYIGEQANVVIVSVKSNDETFAKNYKLIKLFANGFLHYINVFYFFSLQNFIRRQQVTHLITEHPYMGWLGILLRTFTGIKFIVRSQNIEAIRFKTFDKWWWKIMWHYEKWVYQKADFVFFITKEDNDFAIKNYQLPENKCSVLTYGFLQQKPPLPDAKLAAKQAVCVRHHIPLTHCVLLFNGDLGYLPNEIAVEVILSNINPLLLQQNNFPYSLIICGRNLNLKYINQIEAGISNVIYTGFVENINQYFLAADIFINPVITGGGIKTKMVEALGYNSNVVSTVSGAIGVSVEQTNNKLKIVEDNNWQAFAEAVVHTDTSLQIPASFYEHFYWGNIAGKAIDTLQKLLEN